MAGSAGLRAARDAEADGDQAAAQTGEQTRTKGQALSVDYTVAYFTSRREPHFDWFANALAWQAKDDLPNIQLVLVDFYADAPGRKEAMAEHAPTSSFLHLPPKPNVWQGRYRQAKRDYFAASNARNTALIVADGSMFVGVDDLSVPVSGWWSQIKHAAHHRYLALGAFSKVRNLRVENGRILDFDLDPNGQDSRWSTGSDGGIVRSTGSALYGCNFAVPLETAIKVDGLCEGCDAQGAEDYDFGIRLERAGLPVFFNRNMLTLESMEGHELEPSLPREKVRVPNHFLPDPLRGSFPNGMDSDHAAIKSLLATYRTQPLIPSHLKEARELWRKTGQFKEPDCGAYDWRTGALVAAT